MSPFATFRCFGGSFGFSCGFSACPDGFPILCFSIRNPMVSMIFYGTLLFSIIDHASYAGSVFSCMVPKRFSDTIISFGNPMVFYDFLWFHIISISYQMVGLAFRVSIRSFLLVFGVPSAFLVVFWRFLEGFPIL